MAIAVSNLITGSSTSADPTTADLTGFTAGAHVLVWVGASNSADPAPADLLTLSGGSATWTKISTGAWKARRRSWLYIGSGFTGTGGITFTFSGTDPEQFVWVVDQATGLNSTTPYRGAADHQAATTYTSYSIDTSAIPVAGEVVYACCHLEHNQTALAATSFTELGAEAPTSDLGVRRAETGYNSTPLRTAAWTWGGIAEGCAFASIILSDTDTSDLFAFVQAASGGVATSDLEATFVATPTEGNLLIAVLLERGTSNPPTGDSMTTADYIDAGYQRVEGSNNTYRRGMAVYYKFAGASESTLVAGTFDPASVNSRIMIAEFANVGSYNDLVWADNGAVSNGTVLTTGSQSTSGASCLIALSSYKMKNADPGALASISVAYTNDFVFSYKSWGVNDLFVTAIGQVEKSSSGSYTTQTTLSADSTTNSGIHIALLDFDSAGAAPPAAATDSPAILGACF